jgi:integrase
VKDGTPYDKALARLLREKGRSETIERSNKAASATRERPEAWHPEGDFQMRPNPPTRRPYGTGTLHVKAGNWYGRWHLGGKRINRKLGPVRKPGTRDGLTRAQAEKELRRRQESEKVAVAPTRLTMEQAGNQLLDHLEARGRKRSTLEAYRSTLVIHLVPFFGNKDLEDIRREDVERLLAQLRRDGLAPKSILNFLGFLNGVFEFAIRRGQLRDNPVRHVDRPQKQPGSEVRFLALEELEALLRACPDDLLGPVERVLYLAAATTGMRQGELIALRWRDVDWTARRIRVRRNYVRGEFGTPKSKRSNRAVPLIDRLAGELDRLSKTTAWNGDDDLVFGHPGTGKPLDRSKVLKRFKTAMKRAKLGHRLGEGGITFHSLRHTFGTKMAAQGVPMRTLQELMGHRDFATTLVYADYSPNAHEAEWAERAFESTKPREAAGLGPPRQGKGELNSGHTVVPAHVRSSGRSVLSALTLPRARPRDAGRGDSRSR